MLRGVRDTDRGNANRATLMPFCIEPMYLSTFLESIFEDWNSMGVAGVAPGLWHL